MNVLAMPPGTLMLRRYDYRRKLPHIQPDRSVFFVTFNTLRRSVLSDAARDMVLGTCIRGDGNRYELHAVVVMPDHVHLALSPNRDEDGVISIPEIMREIKSISSHRINRQTGHVGRIWQEESFDRAMRTAEDLELKIDYMINNPVRAGLVKSPDLYPWLWVQDLGSVTQAGLG
jgi:REP element-mobilizing transposase RayT